MYGHISAQLDAVNQSGDSSLVTVKPTDLVVGFTFQITIALEMDREVNPMDFL
jgi:hypothetical protein